MKAEGIGVGHSKDNAALFDLNGERHWTSPSVLVVT